MFNTNLYQFLTGTEGGKFTAGADGSWTITLPELLGLGKSEFGGNASAAAGGTVGAIKTNIDRYGAKMLGQVIGIPIAATFATKLLRKPVLTPMNKVLKMVGLNNVKV